MGKYFGTDGIRGVAYEKLNAELAFKVGQAIAHVLKPKEVVIGMDTRKSSPMLLYSIANGLNTAGVDVYVSGVVSTPMIAHYAKIKKIVGVMITASHNPYHDNGIKIFNQGYKMLEDDEKRLEDFIDHPVFSVSLFGQIIETDDVKNEYIKIYDNLNLKPTNMKIGFDSANGANYQISREIFNLINPNAIQIHANPNGLNINLDCGSTHPESIIQLVKVNNLDIGFSFDGDGDRIIVVDGYGIIYDGDAIIYMIGSYLKSKGELNKDTVVLTKMSNPGLLKALDDQGISYILTDVGDKYVSHELTTHGYSIGGESSGHIILTHLLHSGDGLLVAIYLTKILDELGKSLSDLMSEVELYPIRQVNLKNMHKKILESKKVQDYISNLKSELGSPSLLLVRPSGTEPLLRITISSKDETKMDQLSNDFVTWIKKEGEIK